MPTVGVLNPTFNEHAEDSEPVGIAIGKGTPHFETFHTEVPGTPLETFPKQLKLPTPTRFSGSQGANPKLWISGLELHFAATGAHNSYQRIAYALSLLDGNAAGWGHGEANKPKLLAGSWEEFKTQLFAQFTVGDLEIKAKDKLRSHRFKVGSGLQNLFEKLRGWFNDIPEITERMKLDYLESSLWDNASDLVSYLRMNSEVIKTFDAACASLIKQESLLRGQTFNGGMFPSLTGNRSSSTGASLNAVSGTSSSSGSSRRRGRNSHLKCDHCKRTGHLREICWQLHGKPGSSGTKTREGEKKEGK
jgi:hypothetical protein